MKKLNVKNLNFFCGAKIEFSLMVNPSSQKLYPDDSSLKLFHPISLLNFWEKKFREWKLYGLPSLGTSTIIKKFLDFFFENSKKSKKQTFRTLDVILLQNWLSYLKTFSIRSIRDFTGRWFKGCLNKKSFIFLNPLLQKRFREQNNKYINAFWMKNSWKYGSQELKKKNRKYQSWFSSVSFPKITNIFQDLMQFIAPQN